MQLNNFRLNSIKFTNWISRSGYKIDPPLCNVVFFNLSSGKLLKFHSFLIQSPNVELGTENLL